MLLCVCLMADHIDAGVNMSVQQHAHDKQITILAGSPRRDKEALRSSQI
jgi:hypothetical protein